MTDSKLIKEFITVEKSESGVHLLVRSIDWEGHTPFSIWEEAISLPTTVSDEDIQSGSVRILDDPAYFRICTECNERKPNGWMHGYKICQSCAERNHGVLY